MRSIASRMPAEDPVERLAGDARELGIAQRDDMRRAGPAGDQTHLTDGIACGDAAHETAPIAADRRRKTPRQPLSTTYNASEGSPAANSVAPPGSDSHSTDAAISRRWRHPDR